MALLSPGDICYVDYGEIPMTIHVRLLGCHIDQNLWAIITPDGDIYDEEMSNRNPDFVNFIYGGPGLGGAVPPGIPPGSVYGVYAAGARAAMGLAPAGAPAPAAVAAAPVAGPEDPEVWVSLENEPPYYAGQIVVTAHSALPVGHVVLGSNKALIPSGANALAIKKVKMSEVSTFEAKDLRVVPIKFDSQGLRSRPFAETVALMSQDTMPGGELQLEGPATSLSVLKSLCLRNLTPITDHERWIRSSEISKKDRSIYEMEVISKVIEAMVMVDQLNVPNLKSGELLLRRWQLIKEAHRLSPQAPDYSASDFFMGWEQESGVQQSLSKYVADQLKDQAAIAKESRKAKEEAMKQAGRAKAVAVAKMLPKFGGGYRSQNGASYILPWDGCTTCTLLSRSS